MPLPDLDEELRLEEDEDLLLPLLLELLLTDPEDLELELLLTPDLELEDLELLLETPLELEDLDEDLLTPEDDLEEEFLLNDTPLALPELLLFEERPPLKVEELLEDLDVLEATALLRPLVELVLTRDDELLPELLESLNL